MHAITALGWKALGCVPWPAAMNGATQYERGYHAAEAAHRQPHITRQELVALRYARSSLASLVHAVELLPAAVQAALALELAAARGALKEAN